MAASCSPKDDNDNDDCLTSVGFLFEGYRASTLKRLEWQNGSETVSVSLSVIDDDPGALQSGHYLWPAAPALVQHLIENKHNLSNPTCIVELGAGCALASLAALQIFSDSVKTAVATDHDAGTLQRARENRDLTLQNLREKSSVDSVKKRSSIAFPLERLSWGNENDAARVLSLLSSSSGATDSFPGFDLLLGSDLIYSAQVVEPLFKTVSILLQKSASSRFILVHSYSYDENTEDAIDQAMETLGLDQIIQFGTLDDGTSIIIQELQWKEKML